MTVKDIPRSRLLVRTLELLRDRPKEKTLDIIARDTGLKITWLNYISSQIQSNAGASCDRIEVLYEYLSGTKLIIK